jgi:hypothetical protein
MRNVEPRQAGAASGVLNTTRQVGGAVGLAVVGAVLQNRLAAELHTRATAASEQIPAGVRGDFVAAAIQPVRTGLQVGPAQVRAPLLPDAVAQINGAEQLMRQIFIDSYVAAMRPALFVTAAVLLMAVLSCLAIKRHSEHRRRPEPVLEEVATSLSAAQLRDDATRPRSIS